MKGCVCDLFCYHYRVQIEIYRGADKSLARATSRCILFDDEDISFDASLVMYINSTNIPPLMIINGYKGKGHPATGRGGPMGSG